MTRSNLMDWMWNCQDFARQVASGERLEGGPYRRVQFVAHYLVCPFCRRYWKELRSISELQRQSSQLSHHPTIDMNDVKKRLKEKLLRRPE